MEIINSWEKEESLEKGREEDTQLDQVTKGLFSGGLTPIKLSAWEWDGGATVHGVNLSS